MQREDKAAEETQLMQRAAAGDEGAFISLYERYRDRIFNFCRRIVGNESQAEELTQDTFLRLYRARRRYKPSARFSTYLFRIAKNLCLNLRAKHDTTKVDRRVEVPDTGTPDSGRQDQQVVVQQTRDTVRAAIAALPRTQSAALILVHYEGMSLREAAAVLDSSESSVKSLLHRARTKLASELRPLLDESEATQAGEAV